MSEMRYVECCDRMVPAWAAMPFHYSDKPPVYLCKVGGRYDDGRYGDVTTDKEWHTVTAVVTREYEVPVFAADPEAAIAALDDWISDDFEPYEISAQWNFPDSTIGFPRTCRT